MSTAEWAAKLKNRSKLDIIFDVLVSAVGGVKKTHIMSRANLSSEQMGFYFNSLLSHSLIGESRDMDNNMVYKTTEKGLRFIQCCSQIKTLIPPSSKVNKKQQDNLLFL
jgi:predicted transcriptional regulator